MGSAGFCLELVMVLLVAFALLCGRFVFDEFAGFMWCVYVFGCCWGWLLCLLGLVCYCGLVMLVWFVWFL